MSLKSSNPLKREYILHLLLWGSVLLFPYIKFMEREGGYPETFLHELNSILFIIIPSYAFYAWWLPLTPDKRWRSLILLILIFIGAVFLFEFTDSLFHSSNFQPFLWKQFFSDVVKNLAFITFFFALHIVKNSLLQKRQLDEISEGKKQAELLALKAQVTPHFLFNTLNGLYADALKHDEALADSILQLSTNTRYFLKEGQQDSVSIKEELDHIENYIQLQEKRLRIKVTVDFQKNIADSASQISPLLLIPIIENAFKYTSMLRGNGHVIHIDISEMDKELVLKCSNPFNQNAIIASDTEWTNSGIGLDNVKKRLSLLYPGRYSFEAHAEDDNFSVYLRISL